jgi:hypothetical protein
MLDFIRQSLGLGGRYMIFLVWICLDLVINLIECLLYIWHKKIDYVHWFFILLFFLILCPFESWSNPKFDHDLNKLKTWIWKIKHMSFLVTPKWSSWEGFWNFHVWNQKPHIFMLDFMRQSLGLGGRYMISLVWICLDLVYQHNWMLTMWHKKTMCLDFPFF